MSSVPIIALRPESPRTVAPIEVRVLGGGAGPSQVVVASAQGDLFAVAMKEVPGGAAGTFWLQAPGDYRLRATTAGGTAARDFRVAQQDFLGFGVEFGLFLAALLIAGGGLILWFRSRKKAGSISPSSAS